MLHRIIQIFAFYALLRNRRRRIGVTNRKFQSSYSHTVETKKACVQKAKGNSRCLNVGSIQRNTLSLSKIYSLMSDYS